jgi:hypothetical protein
MTQVEKILAITRHEYQYRVVRGGSMGIYYSVCGSGMVFRLAVVFKLTAAIYAVIKLTAPTNPVEFTVFNRRYWYTETGSLTIPIPDLRYVPGNTDGATLQ